MPRYIDADALESHEMIIPTGGGQYEYAEVVYKDDIDEQPTADVRPVIRGEWIEDALANNIYRCSECGVDAPVEPTGGIEYKSNYCPNCGARMVNEDEC